MSILRNISSGYSYLCPSGFCDVVLLPFCSRCALLISLRSTGALLTSAGSILLTKLVFTVAPFSYSTLIAEMIAAALVFAIVLKIVSVGANRK